MKQALAVKNSGPTNFRYADCPECDKMNLLSNERPGTIVDKVFCACGCVFQLSKEMTEKEYVDLHFTTLEGCKKIRSSCENIRARFPVTTRVWLKKT